MSFPASRLSSTDTHSPEQISLTGTRRQTARVGRTELTLLRVSGIPRWSPLGRDPQGLCASSKTPPSCWAREDVCGGGRGPCPAQTLLICTKSPFRVIGWQGSSWAFFFKHLCTEYKSSSLTGLPHKLASDTKKEIENEGSSHQAAGVQASWEESPDPQLVSPPQQGLQRPCQK